MIPLHRSNPISTVELLDEYFMVLMGAMVTEDALLTYQIMINSLHELSD